MILNDFRWFRESTALICCQDKHHTTIFTFLLHWPRPMTFDPLFKVLLVIFQLGTGRHSIRLEKIILGCKFHILGIKTTLGQHIAKNLPVYWVNHRDDGDMRRHRAHYDVTAMLHWDLESQLRRNYNQTQMAQSKKIDNVQNLGQFICEILS